FLNVNARTASSDNGATPIPAPSASPSRGPKLPDASTIASGTGAIVSQTIRILVRVFEGVGNFFIVIFLGLLLAAQPKVYRDGILRFVPRQRLPQAARIIDDISETLRRWLLGQMATMASLFLLTWI